MEETPVQVIADLSIALGNHASVQLDPFLRCIFVPNTTMRVNINQPDNYYSVDGALNLKSGDLAYLNRSFYIKSGSIKFNKDDISNPMITVSAETREKDENGQTVKIVMSVEEQELLDMQPRFSSIPAKSLQWIVDKISLQVLSFIKRCPHKNNRPIHYENV